jgi:hypothetical protein
MEKDWSSIIMGAVISFAEFCGKIAGFIGSLIDLFAKKR